MKLSPRFKRQGAAALAFVCVGVGALLVLPRSGESSDRAVVPAVVVSDDVDGGASSDVVRSRAEVRLVDAAARAEGVFTSIDDIPDGVLAYPLVPGQQVLASAFVDNRTDALGDDFVSVSVRLDAQRWLGPVEMSGQVVDVYEVTAEGAELIAARSMVLSALPTEEIGPNDEAVVSLGVKREYLDRVLVAAANQNVWLVGR